MADFSHDLKMLTSRSGERGVCGAVQREEKAFYRIFTNY
jgi:hypothetical protein